jgi:hypothetical protein
MSSHLELRGVAKSLWRACDSELAPADIGHHLVMNRLDGHYICSRLPALVVGGKLKRWSASKGRNISHRLNEAERLQLWQVPQSKIFNVLCQTADSTLGPNPQ